MEQVIHSPFPEGETKQEAPGGQVAAAVVVSIANNAPTADPLVPEAVVVDAPIATAAPHATATARPTVSTDDNARPSSSAAAQLRRGKWGEAEEQYAEAIVAAFRRGILCDANEGCTLRSYLAKKLACAPMRISKKYPGGSVGKMVYKKGQFSENELSLAMKHIEFMELRFKRSLIPGATTPAAAKMPAPQRTVPLPRPSLDNTVPMAMGVPPVLGPNGQPMNFGLMAVFVPFQQPGAARQSCLTRPLPLVMQQQFLKQQHQLQLQHLDLLKQQQQQQKLQLRHQQPQPPMQSQRNQDHPAPPLTSPQSPRKRPKNTPSPPPAPDGSGSSSHARPAEPPARVHNLTPVKAVPVRDERAASEPDEVSMHPGPGGDGVGAALQSAGDSILDFACMVGDQLDFQFSGSDELEMTDEDLLEGLDYACGLAPPPPFTDQWCSVEDAVEETEESRAPSPPRPPSPAS